MTTLMQRPIFAFGVPGTDTASVTVATQIGVSGKTLTINQSELSSEILDVMVFGF